MTVYIPTLLTFSYIITTSSRYNVIFRRTVRDLRFIHTKKYIDYFWVQSFRLLMINDDSINAIMHLSHCRSAWVSYEGPKTESPKINRQENVRTFESPKVKTNGRN
jgi:hypothetical protein